MIGKGEVDGIAWYEGAEPEEHGRSLVGGVNVALDDRGADFAGVGESSNHAASLVSGVLPSGGTSMLPVGFMPSCTRSDRTPMAGIAIERGWERAKIGPTTGETEAALAALDSAGRRLPDRPCVRFDGPVVPLARSKGWKACSWDATATATALAAPRRSAAAAVPISMGHHLPDLRASFPRTAPSLSACRCLHEVLRSPRGVWMSKLSCCSDKYRGNCSSGEPHGTEEDSKEPTA